MTGLSRAVTLFSALPGNARGAVWMVVASLFYACTYGTVRHLSTDFGTFQIVFFRSALGVLFMLPWALRVGRAGLATKRHGLYWVRCGLNYFGMVLLMWGIANLAIQDVTALMFTSPLFTVLFVSLILGEVVGIRRWTALLVGFCGALIIIRPGFAEVSYAAIGVMSTSAAYALVNTANKSLAKTEDSNLIVFYTFVLMMLVGAVPAFMNWSPLTLETIPWILALGVFSSLATQCVIRAISVGEASVVMPFNFLKLPFAVVIGFTFWNEFPDGWTGLGALVIFSSTWYIARREAALRAQAAAPTPSG
ncbi:MAG: DMT family transporter [Alphaproteobacteria bacterium]